MPEVRHAAVVDVPRELVFELVADVASYPDFIDECSAARVTACTDEEVTAELTLAHGDYIAHIRQDVPASVTMRLAEGPLGRLEGHWHFDDLGDGRSRVDLSVAYDFASIAKNLLLRPAVDRICRRLVESVAGKASRL